MTFRRSLRPRAVALLIPLLAAGCARNPRPAASSAAPPERAELGINLKDDVGSERIVAQKPGGMCQYAVSLAGPGDVDAEVLSVLRRAWDAAG